MNPELVTLQDEKDIQRSILFAILWGRNPARPRQPLPIQKVFPKQRSIIGAESLIPIPSLKLPMHPVTAGLVARINYPSGVCVELFGTVDVATVRELLG